jgi:hypothetical protein
MHTLRVIMGWGFVAIFVYILATTLWVYYKNEYTLSGWERWRATARDSATLLFNNFVALIAAAIGGLSQIADLFNAPELRDWLQAHVGDAKVLSSIILAITVGVFLTRLRTLRSSGD